VNRASRRTDGVSNGRVLLLHGLVRSSGSLTKLERAIAAAGFETLNFAYPSLRFSIEHLAGFVHQGASGFIERNDGPLHIVTHSMGGLVARALIAQHRPASLGRVVMLGPPNQGSEIADLLVGMRAYRWAFGPAGEQLTTWRNDHPPAVDFALGVIAADRPFYLLSWLLIPGPNDGRVSVARTRIDGMADHITVHATHTLMVRNKAVIRETLHFLRHGRFEAGAPP
jgi:pimeloyl-ACP methyl ester carboxylesterase